MSLHNLAIGQINISLGATRHPLNIKLQKQVKLLELTLPYLLLTFLIDLFVTPYD